MSFADFTPLAFLAERAATSLTYVLLFGGMLALLDDWRMKRRWLLCLMGGVIALLMPLLNLWGFLVGFKAVYFILTGALITLCHRTHGKLFWLAIFTVGALTGLCSILSGLCAMPYGFHHRLLFKAPMVLFTLLFLRLCLRPVFQTLSAEQGGGLRFISVLPAGLLAFVVVSAQAMEEHARGDESFFFLFMAAMVLVALTLYGAVFYYLLILRRRQQDTFDNELLQAQMLAVSRRADELVQQEEAERGFLHDLRHHIRALSVCVGAEEWEGAGVLCSHVQETLTGLEASRAAIVQYTGRPVLDAVITFYSNMARELGVECEVKIRFPQDFPFDPVELAAVLANAMENAVNACRTFPAGDRPAAIRLWAEDFGDKWMLCISNPCPDGVELDPNTGLPVSKREGHGYGIRSIANFVKRNGGMLDCSVTENAFTLRLVLFTAAA